MRAILIAAAALALAGCKSTPENGFAVDVTVAIDQSVSSSAIAQIATLDIAVDGAETFHTVDTISSQLTSRQGKFIYRPSAKSGTLTFTITAFDGVGAAIAVGTGAVALKNGQTTTLTVTLSASTALPDLGMPDDLTPGPDIAVPPDFAGCFYVFVSPMGDDANSGCDPTVPKKTITAGIAVSTATDVMVCKGTYNEAIDLMKPIALRGGYDCATWQRTAGFGYPTFDGVNDTVLGAGVKLGAAGATLEGFTVAGPAGGSGTVDTVLVYGTGNHALIKDNHISGGTNSSPSGGSGTVALAFNSGTSGSEVVHNLIEGGGGTSTATGYAASVGIVLGTGNHVHDNTINGGTGVNSSTPSTGNYPQGSVAIEIDNATLTAAAGTAVENNIINGGTGKAPSGFGAGSVGILLQGGNAAIDILHNVIDGGVGNGGNQNAGGIVIQSGTVKIDGNRINAGKNGATRSNFFSSIGVRCSGGTVTIVNNMIHGGETGGQNLWAEDVLADANNVVIRHNTLVGGRVVPNGVAANIHIAGNRTGTIIENNLIIGLAQNSTGVFSDPCLDLGPIASWRGNATLYTQVFGYGGAPGGACPAGDNFASFNNVDTVTTTEMSRCTATTAGACTSFGGVKTGGNVNGLTTCGTDSGCFVLAGCTNPATAGSDPGSCLRQVFASWDSPSDGIVDLITGAGWKLKTNTPCKISKDAIDLTAAVTTDLYGTARTAPPSTGAHEFDGTCL